MSKQGILIIAVLGVGVALLNGLFGGTIQAQGVETTTVPFSPAEEEDLPSGEVKVKLSVGTQSPWDKGIPVTLQFMSEVSGQKAEVNWKYPSNLKGDLPDLDSYYSFQAGEVKTVENTLRPEKPGSYTVVADVVIWGTDSNYIGTDEVKLTIDEDLLVTPRTEGYQNAVLMRYVTLGVGGIVALLLVILGVKKGLSLIPKMIERELSRPG